MIWFTLRMRIHHRSSGHKDWCLMYSQEITKLFELHKCVQEIQKKTIRPIVKLGKLPMNNDDSKPKKISTFALNFHQWGLTMYIQSTSTKII